MKNSLYNKGWIMWRENERICYITSEDVLLQKRMWQITKKG